MGGASIASVLPPRRGAVSRGFSGICVESAKILEFSPAWDFAPGGAKLMIVLEAPPIGVEVGMEGPIVYFADRPVQVSLPYWFVLVNWWIQRIHMRLTKRVVAVTSAPRVCFGCFASRVDVCRGTCLSCVAVCSSPSPPYYELSEIVNHSPCPSVPVPALSPRETHRSR